MSGKMKKLIIVCDEKTEKYANFLRQLISTNDDNEDEVIGTPDGEVEAVVWLDKEYSANKAKVSSKDHVLFVGDSKVCKAETSTMNVKYSRFGMEFGWLGKRGMMRVEGSLSKKEYDEFIDYCMSFSGNDEAESVEEDEIDEEKLLAAKKKAKKINAALGIGNAGLAVAFGIIGGPIGALSCLAGMGIGAGIGKGIGKIRDNKENKDLRYRAVTSLLYLFALQDFLEE